MTAPSPREQVLGAVRKALGVNRDDPDRMATVRQRLESHAPNLIPERAKKSSAERLTLFQDMLEGQSAKVSHAKTLDDIPDIVASYLRENNLPARFRTGSDTLLENIPWQNAPALTRQHGRGQGDDAVTMSRAVTAAAETGTLFLASGDENPTTLNFLPDTHIVVIEKSNIHGSYEDAWNVLRKQYGEGNMPRTVNLVSGPSRTADIEQIIVMGAHGPKRLHVIIVG